MITASTTNATPTALIIDDDAVIRVTVEDYLEEAGFDVREAQDGASGLAAFEELIPDIVLLDVMMPDMDGFTVCEKLRVLPEGEHVPILMVTGSEDIESVRRAYQVGATDFITKPLNYELLVHRVQYIWRAKLTADNLRESESRLAYAQRVAKRGTWELDLTVDEFKYSEEVRRIWGLSDEENAFTYGDMLNAIHHEDRTNIEQAMRRALENGNAYSLDFRVIKPDETEIVVEQKMEIVADSSGNATRMLGTIQDITERREAEVLIRELAYYDNITGLPNRVLLNEHLREALALAKRYKRAVGVLFIDLDRFKRINDTWGHAVGDELLRVVGRRLTKCIRQCDILSRDVFSGAAEAPHGNTVARLGGDEFVALLPELRRGEDAAIVARRINDALSEPFTFHQTEVFVSASIGISTYPTDGENTDVLLKKADGAMYQAKAEGRNGYRFYTADTQTRAFGQLTMEAGLRRALEKDQFILHYQPKIDLHGDVVGMEALVRWENPEVGMVSPADFIPMAEETGHIVPLGEWVSNEACAQTKAWQAAGLESLRVSINLSVAQFRQGDLARMVSQLVAKHDLDANFLELELTESLLMDDVDAQIKILHELRDVGVQLSIDDFGTGYSSLSHLKRFPINTLKLDRSFIRDMETDEDAASIVKGTISLVHSLRLRVVAEGVENQEQTNLLHEYGCDEIQGFFYSRPLPPDEFVAWVRTQRSKPGKPLVRVYTGRDIGGGIRRIGHEQRQKDL